MFFRKKKFYTLLDIKNQIVFTPLIFVVFLSFISLLIVYFFLEYEKKNKMDILVQSIDFNKKSSLKNYIGNVKYNTGANFDDVEVRLSNHVYELSGFINSFDNKTNILNIKILKENINKFEKNKNISFVLFDNLNYKIVHGDDIINHLQTLTNSKIQTQKFKYYMLKNIEYIGDDNLIYWIDSKRESIQLSYFKYLKSSNWFLGAFSKVDDMKALTKKTILDSILIKSKTIENAHFYFYDGEDKTVFNYYGNAKKSRVKFIKNFDTKHDSSSYKFSKYHFDIGIRSTSLNEKVKEIKGIYEYKLILGFLTIIFIALLLITASNVFGRYINTIFNRYNRRLERRNLLYKKWKDRYGLAIIASNDGLWDINLDTKEIFFSNKWLDMFGYKRDDIKYFDDWLNLIHEDDKQKVLDEFDNHISLKSEHFICEYRLKDKFNKYKWILVRGKAFKTNSSNRMLMMSMDIDNRMKLTKRLRDVKLLTEFGRIVLFKWKNDENLSVNFVSKSINNYGYKVEEFESNKIKYFDFVYKDDITELKNIIKDAIKNKNNSFTNIHRVIDKENNIKWVYNRTILIKDDYGKVKGFYGYLNDVTKTKMNEEDLKQQVKDEVEKNIKTDRLLVQQNKLASMGEMLGNIAHQWRQPLNNINLLMYFIRDNFGVFTKEQLNDSINSAKLQIDYMSQTIDDFRNFYHPTKDKKVFDIKESILQASKIIRSLFERNKIELDIKGLDVKINNYENEFEQVIVNILNNASDAKIIKSKNTNFKAKVSISVEQNEKEIKVSILNNCGRIDTKILDKIFEPYFTTKFENQGTGIGLYMVKVIIEENMNGKIEAFNKNDGVEFIITFIA